MNYLYVYYNPNALSEGGKGCYAARIDGEVSIRGKYYKTIEEVIVNEFPKLKGIPRDPTLKRKYEKIYPDSFEAVYEEKDSKVEYQVTEGPTYFLLGYDNNGEYDNRAVYKDNIEKEIRAKIEGAQQEINKLNYTIKVLTQFSIDKGITINE